MSFGDSDDFDNFGDVEGSSFTGQQYDRFHDPIDHYDGELEDLNPLELGFEGRIGDILSSMALEDYHIELSFTSNW